MITAYVKNDDLGVMLFDGARARTEFNSTTQRKDAETGLPLWTVSVVLRQEGSSQSESLQVNVPCASNPADSLQVFTPVAFKGLRMMTDMGDNGRRWVSWRADKVGGASAQAQARPSQAQK